MLPLASVALFAEPRRFNVRLTKISANKLKMSLAILVTLVSEPGLEIIPEEIVLSRLTTPAAAGNDPVCTTLLMTFSTLDQKFKNTESHFTISVLMTKVNHSSINSLLFFFSGKGRLQKWLVISYFQTARF